MSTRILAVALAVLAGSAAAIAAPRESADLVALNGGPIGSKDLPGSANNTVISVTFNGSDGGGAYNATHLTMSGTIGQTFGGTYFREAVVKVTPPGGTPFFAQLINSGANGAGAPVSGSVAVMPVSAFTTAGTWTFEFCDYYNDVTTGDFIDSRWDAFTVSLDDGPAPAPAVGTGPHQTSTNVVSDGLANAANNGVVDWNNATGGAYNALRLSGLITMGNANPAGNLNANTTPDVRIRVAAPSGIVGVVTPVLNNGLSSQTFDVTVPLAQLGSGVGAWNFRFYENADIANVIDNYFPLFTAELVQLPEPPAPAATDVGVVGGDVTATATFTINAPEDVVWVKFTTTADVLPSNSFYVDIDTEGTLLTGTGTGVNDTEIGLYSSIGLALVIDDDDGSDTLSQITLGNTAAPRAATGNSAIPNGRDGTVLAAGTYYVAAGVYDTAFTANFVTPHTASALTTGANGQLIVNIHSNLPAAPALCSPADVGAAGGVAGHDRRLNNNDFIAFITLFFNQDPQADLGTAGGQPGSDSQWNNNDFIAFINYFFNDAANCNG